VDRDSCRDILQTESFRPIGRLDWDLPVDLWWNTEHRLEVAVVQVARWVLVRGTKHYRLTAMGEAGELYVRDLAAFDADLTTRFGEVHMVLSTFPDITTRLARKRIAEKRYRAVGGGPGGDSQKTARHAEELADEFRAAQDDFHRDEALLGLDRGHSDLLKRSLGRRMTRTRRRLQSLQNERKQTAARLQAEQCIEKEYLRKGAATVVQFNISSNIQVAEEQAEFRDAVQAVVKELWDVDRFQIRQKLQGGRLQIFLEEVDAPGVAFVTHWTGAALCPRQLDRLGSEFDPLRQAVEEQFMVFPRWDVVLGGAVKDEKKLVAARVVQNFLKRLEKVPVAGTERIHSPKGKQPIWVGNLQERGGDLGQPWELPLDRAGHILISGRTGSGKSVCGCVIVEGVAGYDALGILLLDPRNQWVGLLRPQDRKDILARYADFGLKATQARGFGFRYHGVGQDLGEPPPRDLGHLAKGRHIVSFAGLDDERRCRLSSNILDAVFEACSGSESDVPRVLVLIDEVTRFTRKGVGLEARKAAAAAEGSLDQVAREGRKYGVQLLLLTQSSKDLARDLATVRQNVQTRIFLPNSDREIEYAADHLEDGRAIASLPVGEAFVCNPQWGTVRVAVRPPLSKLWQPTEAETRTLVGGGRNLADPRPSDDAQAVLNLAREQHELNGEPVRLSEITAQLGMTSRRAIQRIVAELEEAHLAKFRRLPERGQPVVIVPRCAHKPRTEPDGNGPERTGG